MFFFDPMYLLFALPPLILALWAQFRVQASFRKYSQVRSGRGLTGAQAARQVLDAYGLRSVEVERVQGFLSDHYDPRQKVLRLSPGVYDSPSLAAVGVAAHEAGHALQDQQAYAPLRLRSAMVPTVQIGSFLGPILFMLGIFMTGFLGEGLAWLGIILFGAAAAFALVTLPVEFNASRRSKEVLVGNGILAPQEMEGVDKVLGAAALTYVAAAAQAIATLLYYVSFMGRDE